MKPTFQTIILFIFSATFIIAVAVFSGLFSSKNSADPTKLSGTVQIWGTIPESTIFPYINNFNSAGSDYSLSYIEQRPAEIVQNLIVALANDTPPDAILLTSEMVTQFKDKLFPIPFTVLSERSFRDTHVDGAQIFLSTEGTVAIPILVDPLVVYYNKDILAKGTYAFPPRSWVDVIAATDILTKRDTAGGINQSTIALGETANIEHFKDILSALFIQAGNSIVEYNPTFNTYSPALEKTTADVAPAIDFFMSFSDPTNEVYSWNRVLPSSLDMFLSGRSAFYIGRASELFTIQAQNPNLNFDVVEMFQPDNSIRPLTYGSFIGLGVLKSAPNFNAAYSFAALLSGDKQTADDFAKLFSLPPTRRDLIATPQANPYVSVFYRAALSSFAWPDPNPIATEKIFRDMIQNIKSGRSDTNSAINEAQRSLQSNIF